MRAFIGLSTAMLTPFGRAAGQLPCERIGEATGAPAAAMARPVPREPAAPRRVPSPPSRSEFVTRPLRHAAASPIFIKH